MKESTKCELTDEEHCIHFEAETAYGLDAERSLRGQSLGL